MRILLSFYLLLLSTGLFAESTFPDGCRAVPVQGQSVTLKAKKNKLVFIHNVTNLDLWITHPVTEPGASAGWTSRLQAGKWSALLVDKAAFILNCIESRPGHEQQIPCENAIAVCQWKGVKIPASAQGTFWVAEDLSLAALTAAVGGRGFVLPEK
ncbi:hypothetical protein OQJ02_00455 [Legionella sp. PATHC032]|uniref:hypothetical protein n=1 Tax=Legionella TaxID=445 RepID=UPI001B221594|nr:hypothetical protein [Legionella sp. PATHC032]MCW8420106.1 hypothetical protein [Legionella sp. PATHC032]HAZ7573639.1 hypothetical protein [Legionella pneumophila]HBA1635361.1 hypothetical protein [Legionella pneumophila]